MTTRLSSDDVFNFLTVKCLEFFPELGKDHGIVKYNIQVAAFNIATVCLVVAVVHTLFLNLSAALLFGVLGLGLRTLAERQFKEAKAVVMFEFIITLLGPKIAGWVPVEVEIFEQAVWRNFLPLR